MTTSSDEYELDYTGSPSMTVKFTLAGDDLNPEEVTAVLGIVPSKSWRKGEPIPRPKEGRFTPRSTYPFGKWILYSPSSKHEDFRVQIERLLSLLESSIGVIMPLATKYQGEISVAYSSSEDKIGFYLGPSHINRIRGLGVGIDFTIYPVSVDDDDD